MKTTIVNSQSTQSSNELEFAYKVRRALDERIADMPENIVGRLGVARKVAIANKKPESTAFATAPVRQLARHSRNH